MINAASNSKARATIDTKGKFSLPMKVTLRSRAACTSTKKIILDYERRYLAHIFAGKNIIGSTVLELISGTEVRVRYK